MGLFGGSASAGDRTGIAMKEATQFLKNLKKAETDLRVLHKTVDATLQGAKQVMDAPLPHIFEETASGSGGAVKAMETIGGPGFSGEQVSRVTVELGQKMQSQVFAPLQQWVSNYNDAAAKQKVVDKLKEEVEARTKKVLVLRANVDKLRAKQTEGNQKMADKMEAETKVLQHKESKLAIATNNYQQQEEEQHSKLSVLIKDAQYLRVFIKTALALEGQALVAASESMVVSLPEVASTPQPMQPMAGLPHAATIPVQQVTQQLPRAMTLQPTLQQQTTMAGGPAGPQVQQWGAAGVPQPEPAQGTTPTYARGMSYGRSNTLNHPGTP